MTEEKRIKVVFQGKDFKVTKSEKLEIDNCEFEIVDLSKFLLYIKLKDKYESIQNIKTSEGKPLSLLIHNSTLLTHIIHLSEEEQDSILKQHTKFKEMQRTADNYRRAALGGYKQKGSKLHDQILIDRKAELLEYFGRMFSIEEVLSIIKNDWNSKGLKKENIINFYKENLDEINRLKEKHKNDYVNLRLSVKTSRLEELTYLYARAKAKHSITNNREDLKVCTTVLDSIRKEVDGDKITIDGTLKLSVQQDINLHLRNELFKTLSIKEIIIGRLSARMGVSANKLINSLNTSYYSKLNHLVNDSVEDITYEEISYPSAQTYDFDLIKKVNNQREGEERKERELTLLEKEREDKNADKEKIKQQLLERLRNNMNNISEKQITIKNKII